jgi:hypothetical protein
MTLKFFAQNSLMKQWIAILGIVCAPACEPIIMTGSMTPGLLGKPVQSLRLINHRGEAIPFQIDEVTPTKSMPVP